MFRNGSNRKEREREREREWSSVGEGMKAYFHYKTHMNCPRTEPRAYAVKGYRVNSLSP
jgi:hypothetical protein